MTISARIIADSISAEPANVRLTSVQVCLPRIILAELNTHRVFSRNYRSSRAVPVKKMIEEVRTNPYKPIVWLKNKPGMQGGDEMSPEEIAIAEQEWKIGASQAANLAEELAFIGLHKQWANRCLEPYLYTYGIITSTEWSNFFALRRHKDAQPEMRALADAIFQSMEQSIPKLLQPGEWHLPYVSGSFSKEYLGIQLSVARCARVSYFTQEGREPSVDEDLKLYDRLVGSTPLHASPCEHQATPDQTNSPGHRSGLWKNPHLHGNLRGYVQFRKTLENESQ